MYNAPIVPEDFLVPEWLETERFRLRSLTIHDAVKDFDAVMTSETRLRTVFEPGGEWPLGLTLEQNMIELAWHQVEFQLRTSFAYTVVRHDESQVLGCVYIYPVQGNDGVQANDGARENDRAQKHERGSGDHDVEITMWVRESEAQSGLDDHLFEAVESWIARDWPFRNPSYPGRESRSREP